MNAFDPVTGAFMGALSDSNGVPLVNSGLWALAFDLHQGAPGALNPNELYFTAGPNRGNDGLFGGITAIPEPAAWTYPAIGVLGLIGFRARRSFRAGYRLES